jgi:hypothetical protein
VGARWDVTWRCPSSGLSGKAARNQRQRPSRNGTPRHATAGPHARAGKITETLRELGPGFSFVGRQVHFDVDGDDFYVDLLFFHIEHSRYVVVGLKTGKFQPEYAGKLNFYVALVDDVLRREHHNETIGILICGTKNDRSVRYSLGRSTSPMAVAAYTYDKLPPAEQQALPDEGHLVAALEWAEPEPHAVRDE